MKPSIGQCTSMVHDGVDQSLQLLDPVLSKVLILVVRLTLPVINAISMQHFLDLVTDFDLCSITKELSGSSLCLDLIIKCVDELPISPDGINISHQRLHTNSRVNNWCFQIDGTTWAMQNANVIYPLDIQDIS